MFGKLNGVAEAIPRCKSSLLFLQIVNLLSLILLAPVLQAKYEWRPPLASREKLKSDQVALLRARMANLAQGAQHAAAGGTLQAEHTARLIEGVGWMAPRPGPPGARVHPCAAHP